MDVRAAKKQVCKFTPELMQTLVKNQCMVRGGIVKKGKASKKPTTA